ncbi:MAG: Ig-like domain-containing protein [Anaerolineae bacterium]|nr:Ig-like domain-containing protein [Anaerolineae bacterium]
MHHNHDSSVKIAASETTQPESSLRRYFRLTRFDRSVGFVIVLLVAAIGLTILLGDRVGVTLQRVGPLGIARSTSSIIIQFSENMNRESVPERLQVVQIPPEKSGQSLSTEDVLATVNGDVSWNGATLIFRPATALQPGATYQVMLQPGSTSDNGRAVISEYRYNFTVRRPRVAYLAPASSANPFNIWIADPADPSAAQQLTFSPSGIYDFSVSPDGGKIAFSERNSSTGTMDIKMLDLDTGGIEQLTNCADAECKTPVWRPDGQIIAYERIDYNSDMAQTSSLGASPTRIWLIDLSTRPATTRPMFSDSQILGYGIEWSADGQRISMFDYGSQGILVHDFRDDSTVVIPSKYGNPGELSPDGMRVVYPEIILEEAQARSYLQLVDLNTNQTRPLTTQESRVDDDTSAWSPDGSFLVIGRRNLDDASTRGKQLYRMNPADGTAEPLLVDPLYYHGFFAFDPTGTQLVVQRFPDAVALNDPDNPGLPQIWTFDLNTQAVVKIAEDALLPRWVP